MSLLEPAHADEVHQSSDAEEDADVHEDRRRSAASPEHLQESVHRPVDDRQLAEELHGRRHERGREPRSADRAHREDQERSEPLRLLPRLRESGEEHPERRARHRRCDNDERQIEEVRENIDVKDEPAAKKHEQQLQHAERHVEEILVPENLHARDRRRQSERAGDLSCRYHPSTTLRVSDSFWELASTYPLHQRGR